MPHRLIRGSVSAAEIRRLDLIDFFFLSLCAEKDYLYDFKDRPNSIRISNDLGRFGHTFVTISG